VHVSILILGWTASGITLASGLPQALRIYRTRNTDGLSVASYVLWVALSAWWALWAHYVGAFPMFVVNTLCAGVFSLTLYLLRPSKRATLSLVTLVVAGFVATAYVPALAVMGSVGLVVVAAPALLSVMHSPDPSGVSLLTWSQIAVANLLWAVYDAAIGYPLAGLSSLVLAIGAGLVVFHLSRSRAMSTTTTPTPVTV
jgi:MtN3 and saliva related transmembrane protein